MERYNFERVIFWWVWYSRSRKKSWLEIFYTTRKSPQCIHPVVFIRPWHVGKEEVNLEELLPHTCSRSSRATHRSWTSSRRRGHTGSWINIVGLGFDIWFFWGLYRPYKCPVYFRKFIVACKFLNGPFIRFMFCKMKHFIG